jgi:predicted DNA-binding transcriptional regulator YafY
VPITGVRGTGGGYAIDARKELPPLALTPGGTSAPAASLVAVGPCASAPAPRPLRLGRRPAAAQPALAELVAALRGSPPVDKR